MQREKMCMCVCVRVKLIPFSLLTSNKQPTRFRGQIQKRGENIKVSARSVIFLFKNFILFVDKSQYQYAYRFEAVFCGSNKCAVRVKDK